MNNLPSMSISNLMPYYSNYNFKDFNNKILQGIEKIYVKSLLKLVKFYCSDHYVLSLKLCTN